LWSKRLLGLDPQPVSGHVFAVDGQRVRYAYFAGDVGDLECREFHSQPLAEGTFQDGPLGGPVRDVEAFVTNLKSLLERIPQRPAEMSLVLPDEWLRVTFAELGSLPRGANREDVLRFKLKRLVPYRVEDLRLAEAEVPALTGSESGRRFLLGFGNASLLTQIETAFEGLGVTAGHLSNEGLSVLPALAPILKGALAGVVYVTETSYTLIVTQDARPTLHRFKVLAADDAARGRLVPRDLRLTRSYVRQEVKGRRLGELILIAPQSESGRWKAWLEDAFEHPVRSLSEEQPELPGTVTGVPSWESAPLLGAASRGIE